MKCLHGAQGLAIVLAITSLMVGCNRGPEIASVEGTITMDGEPLVDATVIFTPVGGGRPAAARTDEQGHYVLNFSGGRKGAQPGDYIVRVTTAQDPYEDEEGNPVPARRETIPMEYNQESTLKFTVEAKKKNIANFDLKSGGKVVDDASGY